MFPETTPKVSPLSTSSDEYEITKSQFVADARSQLSSLLGEVAARNKQIVENDGYIYSDLLPKMLDVPIGHDRTSVNWLRRTVEIHKTQFMGSGFSVSSTYDAVDIGDGSDPQEEQRLIIENEKRKAYAEQRELLINTILRDNDGDALWMAAAENASAVGDAVFKTWYNSDKGKFEIQLVEAVENCYALWKKDNFREFDLFGYVYQVSKTDAIKNYNAPDDVPTSPLGAPLAVIGSANYLNYISTQPMVTIMEVTGIVYGWCSYNGVLKRCDRGTETPINAVLVGNNVYQLIDDPLKLPKYYIAPNKRMRRRPWGLSDVTQPAININLTYIETLSDWRTLASKANFPKFKYFGFPPGIQMPKPKARTVEGIPLSEGQDIQPLAIAGAQGEMDFQRQCEEIKSEFVREVGIGAVLFDAPGAASNSNQAMITSMSSITDITESKRRLWSPIIVRMLTDALETLAQHDDNISELVNEDEDWHLRIEWPSYLNQDDPVYHAMLLNRFNAGALSIQSYMEALGDTKEELDRIREEMQDPLTGAIHARSLGLYMEYKFFPPSSAPPKTSISLRGDLTPEQEGNLAVQHGFNQGPFGTTAGPQGNQGLRAEDQQMNSTYLTPGTNPSAVEQNPQGTPVAYPGGALATQGSQGSPGPVGTPAQNTPGSQPVSQPGSGQPQTTPVGKANQKRQHSGG